MSECALRSYHASGHADDPNAVFTDQRTGRSYCHKHIEMLVTWELSGAEEDGAGLAYLLRPPPPVPGEDDPTVSP